MSVTGTGGLAGLSVRRPWLAAVINLLIVIAGIAGLMGLEVRELPDIDRPVVSVRANYPGASPTTVDAEVTRVIEGAVARVAGALSVRSSSEQGNFRMRIEFRPSVDLFAAANDVREAVSRVTRRLPDGVRDVTIVKSDADAWAVVRFAAWSPTLRLSELTRRIEADVVPEMTAVEGIAQIRVRGGRERVLRVDIAPDRLAAYGLSVEDVADVLADAQFDVPVGSFEAGAQDILVRADATVSEPAQIEQLRLRGPIRLGDVAMAYYEPEEPTSIARLDVREVVSLGVVRQARANTVALSTDLAQVVERLETRFPEIRLTRTEDEAVFIEGAIAQVLGSLAVALLIVVGVIRLFFGSLGATIVPAVAIPVALTGALGGIWAFGFSINLVTLLALVLATGLVVDDAIVVLENIQRRRRDMGPGAAAVIGTREVFFAVIATTATLIAVFVPISFLPSSTGRLFREFGVVLALTVAISSLVALTLAPMIAARLPGLDTRQRGPVPALGRLVAAGYGIAIRAVLAAPLVAVTLAALLAGGAAFVYPDLGRELVPDEDRGVVSVGLQGPDGTGLDYTDRQVEQVEALFEPWLARGVARDLASVTGQWDLNRGLVTVRLIPWADRTVSQARIEADIKTGLDDIAGANAWTRGGNSLGIRGGGKRLEIALTGPDFPSIAEAAFAFSEAMEREMPELSYTNVRYQATQPQLSIAVDRAAAADLDVPVEALSRTLAAQVDGDEVAELTVDDTAVPVILGSAEGTVRDPADLLNLQVRSRGGALVPLLQLVTLDERGVAAELDRYGQRRAVRIAAGLSADLTLAEAVSTVQTLARTELPAGIDLLLLGEAADLGETSNAVAVTFAIALVVVFLVLLAQFESLVSASIVMLTVPLGVCGAIYALWLTGMTLNIYSQIGVLMLIGIMAKNGILLVEFADQLRDRGLDAADAAREAAMIRLRPIAMTLASTVLAAVPLILASGAGSEARAAIGWVIFGGLGLSAGVTLFATPALYAILAPLAPARATAAARLDAELDRMASGRSSGRGRPDASLPDRLPG